MQAKSVSIGLGSPQGTRRDYRALLIGRVVPRTIRRLAASNSALQMIQRHSVRSHQIRPPRFLLRPPSAPPPLFSASLSLALRGYPFPVSEAQMFPLRGGGGLCRTRRGSLNFPLAQSRVRACLYTPARKASRPLLNEDSDDAC